MRARWRAGLHFVGRLWSQMRARWRAGQHSGIFVLPADSAALKMVVLVNLVDSEDWSFLLLWWIWCTSTSRFEVCNAALVGKGYKLTLQFVKVVWKFWAGGAGYLSSSLVSVALLIQINKR